MTVLTEAEPPVLHTGPERGPVQLSLFGGGVDTGNMGVAALSEASITGLAKRLPGVTINEFDHTPGLRTRNLGEGEASTTVRSFGALWSRRHYRADTLDHIRTCARWGGLWSRGARMFRRSAAILDISGGDSFTDLYSTRRFRFISMPKLMALEHGIPLILLPQTYGPYRDPACSEVARRILAGADLAWARDPHSLGVAHDLLGKNFDPDRHRLGVDVAFDLPCHRPPELPRPLSAWLDEDSVPIIGVNVSGLIYGDSVGARGRFGFRADYRAVIANLVRGLLARSEGRILLVPHVLAPTGHHESDHEACMRVLHSLHDAGVDEADTVSRVAIVPQAFGASELKWLISRCDWFCGTRMHSTIAALSSGVPTAAISYSDKTLGVFETCGQGEHVADPRTLGTDEVVEHVLDSFDRREEARTSLQQHLPRVLQTAEWQMDEIAGCIEQLAAARA